jgi:hypothetical protein
MSRFQNPVSAKPRFHGPASGKSGKIAVFSLFIIINVTAGLYAFDRSLNGSWGIVKDGEKTEIIRFNNTELFFADTLFLEGDYAEAENTIYVEEEEEFFLIQYHLLSSNKLLFIMTGENDFSDSITLILSRL